VTDFPSRVFRSTLPALGRDSEGFRTLAWAEGVPETADALEPNHPTVLHAFVAAAKARSHAGITLLPEDPSGEEETRSYRELCRDAQHVAARLKGIGVEEGDRVLIVLPTSFDFVISFFAVQMLRAVPVPSYPPAMMERAEVARDRIHHLASQSGAAWCVANQKLVPLMGDLALDVPSIRDVVTVERLEGHGRTATIEPRARGHEPAFIQYTSGSTGRPKGVLLSHTALVSNIHAIGQATRINRRDVAVSWLPLYHDMGLIGALLFSIYWRIPLVLMSPVAFLMNPRRWLEAITAHGGTLSPAPNFGYARCLARVPKAQREGLDLSTWRLAFNGAEPVNARTLERFFAAFGPCGFRPSAMLPVYGLAESSLAVTFPRPEDPLRTRLVDRQALARGEVVDAEGESATTIVGVGRAIPGHEFLVVDADGAPIAERAVGHIVVRGPSLMDGYYGNDEATRAVLAQGWLWTGDLGFVDRGDLFVTGRAKDLIIVRGRNYYAEDVEGVAERVEGVRRGCVIAFGVYDEGRASDLLVIVCESRARDPDQQSEIARAVAEAVGGTVGIRVDEVVVTAPGTLPKTSSGKRQRAYCRTLYLEGRLAERRTGKLGLARIFARSGVGFVASRARALLGRRAPE
jgi:acyl-CoA synthetase (AMP-forming)/AMP-acid ligase II